MSSTHSTVPPETHPQVAFGLQADSSLDTPDTHAVGPLPTTGRHVPRTGLLKGFASVAAQAVPVGHTLVAAPRLQAMPHVPSLLPAVAAQTAPATQSALGANRVALVLQAPP